MYIRHQQWRSQVFYKFGLVVLSALWELEETGALQPHRLH